MSEFTEEQIKEMKKLDSEVQDWIVKKIEEYGPISCLTSLGVQLVLACQALGFEQQLKISINKMIDEDSEDEGV